MVFAGETRQKKPARSFEGAGVKQSVFDALAHESAQDAPVRARETPAGSRRENQSRIHGQVNVEYESIRTRWLGGRGLSERKVCGTT